MDAFRHLHWWASLVVFLGPRQALRYLAARAARRASPMRVRVAGLSHPVLVRPARSDMWALWQVFGLGECALRSAALEPVRTIVDAGANVGYASLYYAQAYPDARILAIEPDAENARVASENLRHHANAKVLRGALWHRSAPVEIENPGDQSWAFRVKEKGAGAPAAVPGYTMPELLRTAGFDGASVVKIDVEGAELQLFREGPLDWLDACGRLVIEVHGEDAEDAVVSAMKARPFSLERQGEKLVFTRVAPPAAGAAPRGVSA